MKLFLIAFSILLTASAWSQNDLLGKKEKDSCYFQYKTVLDNGVPKRVRLETKEQKRYVEWECGKVLGVVDCNNELTYDEGNNTVYLQSSDMSNTAANNRPFTGKCESCYMNGRTQRRVEFVDGKENGTDTTFYESGCPQIIRTLVQGVDHGTWYYMLDSTQMLGWEMSYNMGEKHGKHIFFKLNRTDPNKLRLDTTKWENYNMGVLHGWRRTYHDNGVLKREIMYENGVYNGPFRIFNEERVIVEELNYKKGKKDKECTYYYDDGTLLRTENWDEDVKHGDFKTFYYQGHIQTTETYKKGLKEGWFQQYYPDQTTKNRSLYKKDVLIEEHRFDENGRETYSFGTPTSTGAEDDQMPDNGKKKKKEKKKKAKKEKKTTSEEGGE